MSISSFISIPDQRVTNMRELEIQKNLVYGTNRNRLVSLTGQVLFAFRFVGGQTSVLAESFSERDGAESPRPQWKRDVCEFRLGQA